MVSILNIFDSTTHQPLYIINKFFSFPSKEFTPTITILLHKKCKSPAGLFFVQNSISIRISISKLNNSTFFLSDSFYSFHCFLYPRVILHRRRPWNICQLQMGGYWRYSTSFNTKTHNLQTLSKKVSQQSLSSSLSSLSPHETIDLLFKTFNLRSGSVTFIRCIRILCPQRTTTTLLPQSSTHTIIIVYTLHLGTNHTMLTS